jgi:hypothetical protein
MIFFMLHVLIYVWLFVCVYMCMCDLQGEVTSRRCVECDPEVSTLHNGRDSTCRTLLFVCC